MTDPDCDFPRLHDAETLPFEYVADGDLLAFRGTGFWSRLIRFRTTSIFTHVGLALWLEVHGQHRLYVMEAKEGIGVRLYPLDRLLLDPDLHVDLYKLKTAATGIDRRTLVQHAQEHVGKPYASVWQFLRSWGLVSRRMADRFGWPADTDTERFHCSEFVLQCLREAGYRENGDRLPPRTSPGDLTLLPCFMRLGRL